MARSPFNLRRLATTAVGITLGFAALTPFAGSAGASGPEYTVAPGDTLFGIASSNGVTIDALLAANGLTLSSTIHPGQQLSIPDAAPTASGAVHTVAAGDTLGGIAVSAGVSLSDLLVLNGLTASSLIVPGDSVQIPAGGSSRSASAAGFSSGPSTPAVATGNARVNSVLNFALAQVGTPYVFFTKGGGAFDCSGLTLAAYGQVGVDLVHHAATQALQGDAVDFWNNSIQAGDLVFLDGDWDGVIDHVGIATSSSTWVHASQTHGKVVTDSLPSKSVIISVRRYV